MCLRIVSGAHANTGAAVCLHDTCTYVCTVGMQTLMWVCAYVCVCAVVCACICTYVHLLDVHICTTYTCAHVGSQAVDGRIPPSICMGNDRDVTIFTSFPWANLSPWPPKWRVAWRATVIEGSRRRSGEGEANNKRGRTIIVQGQCCKRLRDC